MKKNIYVSNYGWYLFDTIPLIGGNASEMPLTPFVLFRNDVKMDKLQDRLMKEAERQQRQVENLVWNNNDMVLLNIPGLEIPFPVPYIITYREKQISGELK